MITRIVKMTFKEDCIEAFLQIYRVTREKILSMKGCSYVKLLNDKHHKNIFFTYSSWESEDHLNRYRNSELFEKVWEKTKALFAEKAEAWTAEEVNV